MFGTRPSCLARILLQRNRPRKDTVQTIAEIPLQDDDVKISNTRRTLQGVPKDRAAWEKQHMVIRLYDLVLVPNHEVGNDSTWKAQFCRAFPP
jgi:hypothetical protein